MSLFIQRGPQTLILLAFFALASLIAFPLFAGSTYAFEDVLWLKDVTAAPAIPEVDNLGHIEPLLPRVNGKPVETKEEWERYRPSIRERWIEFLGPMPEPRPEVALEILKTELLPTIIRQLIRYEGEPGIFVEGYLLMPKAATESKTKYPAVLAMHPTTNATIDDIAGISGQDTKQFGLALAQRGFIVFCPRCFLWQDVTSLNEAVDKHRERHPRTTGMAKMLYDAMRGVDVLESLPQVDRARIGAIGHSLGAKEALYLAAFDERIKAAAASEGGLGFRSTNWDAPWYLGEAIRDPEFPLNHHQLLGLIAPRPFLILGGESGPGAADGDRSWPLINAALPVWKLYGEPTRLGLLNHHEGHSVSPQSFERMAEWLTVYLDASSSQ